MYNAEERALESLPRHRFAKGPLVGFSHAVAATLVAMPELDADEAYALGDRKRLPLRHVVNGKVYSPERGFHPRRAVIFDDIYYGYLMLKAFANEPLSLVTAPISEVDKSLPNRLNPQRGLVRIYHKLKTAERFGWINRSETLKAAIRDKVHTSFTCNINSPRERTPWKVHLGRLDNVSSRVFPNLPDDDGRFGVRNVTLTRCCQDWMWCYGA